jgi:membrane protease YdiL (CAAX protease family)
MNTGPVGDRKPRPDARRHARELMLLVAFLFGGWTVWSTQVLPRLPEVEGHTALLRSIAVRSLLWVLPAGAYLWWRYRERALDGLRLNLPPTLRHWSIALVVTALASFAVSLDVARKLGLSAGEVWTRLLEQYVWEFPTAPLFEEFIFRGVILAELLALLAVPAVIHSRDLEARQRAWLANAAATMVFVGLHWPWWIYTMGFGTAFWVNSAGVMLISLVLGMLFFRSQSIWPCVVLHWLNNLLSSLAQSP